MLFELVSSYCSLIYAINHFIFNFVIMFLCLGNFNKVVDNVGLLIYNFPSPLALYYTFTSVLSHLEWQLFFSSFTQCTALSLFFLLLLPFLPFLSSLLFPPCFFTFFILFSFSLLKLPPFPPSQLVLYSPCYVSWFTVQISAQSNLYLSLYYLLALSPPPPLLLLYHHLPQLPILLPL